MPVQIDRSQAGRRQRISDRLLGYYYDLDLAAYYLRVRIYGPGLGRFLTRDLFRYADHPNLYGYAHNNPLLSVDPSGRGVVAPCPTPWKSPPVWGKVWQYGCYCGLEPTPPRAPATIPKPIDELDKCCQAHDTCYGTTTPKATCDARLCTCAKNVFAVETNPTPAERIGVNGVCALYC